ncbi:hypothetical protein chiPu_0027104, partial [Chiloscyllium punctatum]|nr:hypothetical protein [Chiloscyllium punctatum]
MPGISDAGSLGVTSPVHSRGCHHVDEHDCSRNPEANAGHDPDHLG